MQTKLMTLLAAAGFGALLASASPSIAQASGQCATPGTVKFDGLAERRADIVPSVHRQLSGLGRLALSGDCNVVITCVIDPALDADGKKIRDRQCSAARSAISMFERRTNVRTELVKSYEMSKVTPSGSWAAGSVYVSLN